MNEVQWDISTTKAPHSASNIARGDASKATKRRMRLRKPQTGERHNEIKRAKVM